MPQSPVPVGRTPNPTYVRRILVLGAALLAVLMLSGCLKVQVGLSLGTDDTISGTVLVTKSTPKAAGASGSSQSSAPAIPVPSGSAAGSASAALNLPTPSVTVGTITAEDYSEGDQSGYKYIYKKTTFADAKSYPILDKRGGAMVFTRRKDTVSFSSTLNLTYSSTPTAQDALISKNFDGTVKITFPGKVVSSNGTVDGNSVTWKLEPLKENVLTATATYPQAAAPVAKEESNFLTKKVMGLPVWLIGAGALVVILLLIGLVALVRARRKDDDPEASEEAAIAWGLTGEDTYAGLHRPPDPDLSADPEQAVPIPPPSTDGSATRQYSVLPPPPPQTGQSPTRTGAHPSTAGGPPAPPYRQDFALPSTIRPPVFAPPPPQFATAPAPPPVVPAPPQAATPPPPAAAPVTPAPQAPPSSPPVVPTSAVPTVIVATDAGWPPPQPQWQDPE